jgi:hypothetical protein
MTANRIDGIAEDEVLDAAVAVGAHKIAGSAFPLRA